MGDQNIVKTLSSTFPAIGSRGLFLHTAIQSLGEAFTAVACLCLVRYTTGGDLSHSIPSPKCVH